MLYSLIVEAKATWHGSCSGDQKRQVVLEREQASLNELLPASEAVERCMSRRTCARARLAAELVGSTSRNEARSAQKMAATGSSAKRDWRRQLDASEPAVAGARATA